MTNRYALPEEEWNQTEHLFPLERTGKPGRPSKPNRPMFDAIVWMARSGAPWRDLPEHFDTWERVYSRYRKWLNDGFLDNISDF